MSNSKPVAFLHHLVFVLGFLSSLNAQAATTITGLWPGSAAVGESVSVFIFGSEFSTDGSTEVYFNGNRQFLVAAVSPDMLIVRITVTAELFGPVSVNSPNGIAVGPTDFGTAGSSLGISGIWPGSANTGDALSVFVFGSGFTTDNTTQVRFNGIQQFLVAPISPEMLIVRIGNATPSLTGYVEITTPGGSTTSSDMFVVHDPIGPARWGGFNWNDGSTWQ